MSLARDNKGRCAHCNEYVFEAYPMWTCNPDTHPEARPIHEECRVPYGERKAMPMQVTFASILENGAALASIGKNREETIGDEPTIVEGK